MSNWLTTQAFSTNGSWMGRNSEITWTRKRHDHQPSTLSADGTPGLDWTADSACREEETLLLEPNVLQNLCPILSCTYRRQLWKSTRQGSSNCRLAIGWDLVVGICTHLRSTKITNLPCWDYHNPVSECRRLQLSAALLSQFRALRCHWLSSWGLAGLLLVHMLVGI